MYFVQATQTLYPEVALRMGCIFYDFHFFNKKTSHKYEKWAFQVHGIPTDIIECDKKTDR